MASFISTLQIKRLLLALVLGSLLSSCTLNNFKLDKDLEAAKDILPDAISLKIQESSSGLSFDEGSSLILLLSLSQARTVDTTADLSIMAVGDATFSSVFSQSKFSFTIPAGETVGHVSISTLHDVAYTGSQSFKLSLATSDDAVKVSETQLTISVLDLEAAPVISFASPSQNISESAGSGSVVVSLNRASKYSISVPYTFTAGTATSIADFTGAAGDLLFSPGETSKTISFTIAGDTTPEATETFTISLGVVTGTATLLNSTPHTVNIIDDDSATLSVNNVSGNEGSSQTFTVTLNPASTQTVTVDYATSNGTASAGTHYTAKSGSLTFAAGETSKTVIVNTTAISSEICAADRTFKLNLSNAVSSVIGTSFATGTIVDPDVPSVSLAASSGTEGGNVIFTASLSQACSTKAVSFSWATSSGTAISGTDFGAVSSAGSIAAGSTSTTLSVATIQNTNYDGDKTFSVTLSSLVNAIAGTLTNTGTIHDDEVPLGSFAISGISAASGDSTVDTNLVNSQTPTVNWAASTNATSYDVTIYASNGTTVACATQNTTSLSLNMGAGCVLTTNTGYKAKVVAKLGSQTQAASNSLFTFWVDASPTLGAAGTNGPWYVMSGSSITINALYGGALAPSGVASDAEGDTVTFTSVGSAGKGTITNNSSNIVYSATGTGKDTFTFTISDSRGGTFTSTMTIHVVTTYTWIGGSSNTWSSSASGNWCGTVKSGNKMCNGTTGVPSSTSTAIIDDTCITANCTPTTNFNVGVAGLKVNGNSLTLGSGNTLTVGSSGYSQTGGTFNGGNSAILVSGDFSVTGGTFVSTSSTLSLTGTNVTIDTSATYTHSDGTLVLNDASNAVQTISASGVNLKNLSIPGYDSRLTLSTDLNVLGNLTLNDSYNSGGRLNGYTINLSGNLTASSYGKAGSTKIKMIGSASQTLTGSTDSFIPNMEIASTGGTVSFAGNLYFLSDFKYTSGSLSFGTSNLWFVGDNGNHTITAPNLNFYSMTFSGYNATATLSGAINILGTLTLADRYQSNALNGSTISILGNLAMSDYGHAGTALLKIAGSSNQSISATGSNVNISNIEIASTGGTVSFSGVTRIQKNFTYTSGTVDFGTSTIWFGADNANRTIVAAGLNFYNLGFNGYNDTTTISSVFNVLGTLTIADNYQSSAINGAAINAKGNVTTAANGSWGTTIVKIAGSSNQLISATTSTGGIPNLEIASTGGTVSFSGTLPIRKDFTYTSGTLDFGTSTIAFGANNYSRTITAAGVNFYNLYIGGYYDHTTLVGAPNVYGTLTLDGSYSGTSLDGYGIYVYGNLSITNVGLSGTSLLGMVGSTNATISYTTGASIPGAQLQIAKDPGYKVTLSTNLSLLTASQNLTVAGGELNLAGKSLTVPGVLRVKVAGTLTAAGGSFTPNSGTNFICNGTCNP